ncbi:hypothetical protein ACNKHL_10190 [Shigella flexneri]
MPNGKAQHIKGFLNRFAKTAKKTRISSTVWRSWGCQWWASIVLVLCYRDEYKLALARNVASLTSYWRMNRLASALESQPVATVSGESWYFFGHCTEVTALPGAPAQWAAIFARFGAKLENVSVALLRHGRDLQMKRKTIKIRSGFMSYPAFRLCSDCRVTAVWRPDIPAVARSNGLKARGT